jgi:cellulase/cellobiase CelA1
VQWDVNEWNTGFTATVTITNRGAALNGWTLTWTFPGNQQITNSWNSQSTQSGAAVTARNAAWNATVPAGGTVSFGFQATYSGTNTRPAAFQLNGRQCT